VSTLQHNERLCVNHYYDALERNRDLRFDDTVPPRMAGVTAKPVAGS